MGRARGGPGGTADGFHAVLGGRRGPGPSVDGLDGVRPSAAVWEKVRVSLVFLAGGDFAHAVELLGAARRRDDAPQPALDALHAAVLKEVTDVGFEPHARALTELLRELKLVGEPPGDALLNVTRTEVMLRALRRLDERLREAQTRGKEFDVDAVFDWFDEALAEAVTEMLTDIASHRWQRWREALGIAPEGSDGSGPPARAVLIEAFSSAAPHENPIPGSRAVMAALRPYLVIP